MNATSNVCKSGKDQKLQSERSILNQEEKKSSFVGSVEAREATTCDSDFGGLNEIIS